MKQKVSIDMMHNTWTEKEGDGIQIEDYCIVVEYKSAGQAPVVVAQYL